MTMEVKEVRSRAKNMKEKVDKKMKKKSGE